MSGTVPITPPKPRSRIPSGPRPKPEARESWRSSSSVLPYLDTQLEKQPAAPNITGPPARLVDSPEDDANDILAAYSRTDSPEEETRDDTVTPLRTQRSMPAFRTTPLKERSRTVDDHTIPLRRDDPGNRMQAVPTRAESPASFLSSLKPSTPRTKPTPARLNTADLGEEVSPAKTLSPGLKHWQQVRQHVIATPPDSTPKPGRRLVAKAAGRLGFRQFSGNVLAEEKRMSSTSFMNGTGALSLEEQEAIAKERKRFAHDIKACLDACSAEETKRRLQRSQDETGRPVPVPRSNTVSTYSASGYAFDPGYSCFAPLLMELHRFLPDARAKRPWCRTCPHHATILAELGFAFLQDGVSTDGERQQALEVFGVIVRNWAPDSAEEQLDRWTWVIRALLTPDRQLRTRGLSLLAAFFGQDVSLPRGPEQPTSALAVEALAMELLSLVHAVETAGYGGEQHLAQVNDCMLDLAEGSIISLDPESLAKVLDAEIADELEGRTSGAEKEMIWMGVSKAIGHDPQLARWLLRDGGAVLKRFLPPPLLHATPPIILHLRTRSTISLLSSLATVLRSDESLNRDVWRIAAELVFPDLEELPDARDDVTKMVGIFLVQLELVHQAATGVNVRQNDPFLDDEHGARMAPSTGHRELLATFLKQEAWREGTEAGVKELLQMTSIAEVLSLTRTSLAVPPLLPLAHLAIAITFDRCADEDLSGPDIETFLLFLQHRHPRLFYKALFSLSASVSSVTLAQHRRIVHTTASIVGPDKYWLNADPQMVVIVLMGDTAPKPNKGKSKEGTTQNVNVRLGRYACLVELIEALVEPALGSPKPKDKHTRAFVDAIENRLGPMLVAEEKDSTYPDLYRTLLASLFYRFRAISQSVRKSSWQHMIIRWFLEPPADSRTQLVAEINGAYGSLHKDKPSGTRVSGTMQLRQSTQVSITSKTSKAILDTPFLQAVERLLMIIHAAFSTSDWNSLVYPLWSRFTTGDNDAKSLSFLLMKCGETVPERLREEVTSEMSSTDTKTRLSALNKLVSLYLCRFDVLSQLIVTDRRGPVFHFPQKTHEIVTTEIGSPHWLPPQEIQDAALQKFGTGLPLELRQRLMDLGWADDEDLAGKSDWDQVPITDLPTLHWQDVGVADGASDAAESSPLRALMRHASSTSGTAHRSKKRKAVFAPVLVELIVEQATLYAQETNVEISFASRGLIKLLQRDDPVRLLQPISSRIADDFEDALRYLDNMTVALTPGFAYTALNTLVGYLKVVMRSNTDFPHLAKALESISRLVTRVSGISLRDVRKNKAEHILLPASIHEDEGGFKLHLPWQTGDVEVQTAQLLVLAEFLKANPRDVYMVKKMVSNLPTQASIPHSPFARAWLLLIITLFSTLNRNYNDRAELRHFLTNIGAILRHHGSHDMIVASHAMRVYMLCSARFRRLFASMGIATVMGAVYDLYAKGRQQDSIRDCVEYSMRSFFRIHQDHFVHQTAVVISEVEWEGGAVYGLLACLSSKSTVSSGVASGLKGLNDKEELEALIQMLSRPELSLHEVGHAATERLAAKMASIDLDAKSFPKENIIRLFVTVIAANPAATKSINLVKLLAGITPYFEDLPSKDLLKDSIEALAGIVSKGKVGNDAARLALHPGTEDVAQDWLGARRVCLHLVEAYAKSGGILSPATTKRTLELAVDLIKQQTQHVGPTVASLVGSLAKTHLSSRTLRPLVFLRDMAPMYRTYIDMIDFSSLLDEISAFVKRSTLDQDLANVIVDSFTAPAVRLLASAADDNMVFFLPLRSSTVSLLAAISTVRPDTFACVESHPANASILSALVFPMCLRLEVSGEGMDRSLLDSLWLRILNYAINPFRRRSGSTLGSSAEQVAALCILSLQIIKIVIVRAPSAISNVQGLWTYLARQLMTMIEGGNARFIESTDSNPFQATWAPPRVVDWMAWSLFQLIALLRNSLSIEFQSRIETALRDLQDDHARHDRLSPSPQNQGASLRTPSSPYASRTPSASTQRRPRRSSGISSLLVPSRAVSGTRPSFQELSERRTSRTTFEAFKLAPKPGYTKRFPSSAPVRSVGRSAGGQKKDAIVHLLGTPSSPTSAFSPSKTALEDPLIPAREIRLENESLVNDTRIAVQICQMIYHIETEDEPDHEELPRFWTANDAIDAITEETRILIEEEFRDVFSAPQEEWTDIGREESRGYSVEQLESKYDDVEEKVPILEISQP